MKINTLFVIVIASLLSFNDQTLFSMKPEKNPLIEAILSKDEALARTLILQGADVNAKDTYGATPLFAAIETGQVNVFKLLIENKVNIHIRQEFPQNRTPLIAAVLEQNRDIVRLLVEQGADVNAAGDAGETPLMLAAEYWKSDIVSYLLHSGKIEIEAKNHAGNTALICAVNQSWLDKKGGLDTVKLLLDAGANAEQPSSLQWASNPEIRKLIQETLDKKYATIRCSHRNLIIIIDDGGEVTHEASSKAALSSFISALEQEYAFILIPFELWDSFLHAEIDDDRGSEFGAKILFKQVQDRWEVYKIHTTTESAEEDFYVFCPKKYKQLLTTDPNRPSIRVKEILPSINPECLDVGMNLLKKDLDNEPLKKQSEMGPLFDTFYEYMRSLKTSQKLAAYSKQSTDLDAVKSLIGKQKEKIKEKARARRSIIINNFVSCLEKLLVLKQAQKELERSGYGDIKLPQYNIYILGHGISTTTSPQLESLMKQAQALGYWPSGGLQLSTLEIEKLKEQPSQNIPKLVQERAVKKAAERTERLKVERKLKDLPSTKYGKEEEEKSRATLQKFETERKTFKKEQAAVGKEIVDNGSIAGLSADVFGKMLEVFDGITNFLFVATCHGGGMHLVLPFIFMSSPHTLSYTLANNALLSESIITISPKITINEKHEYDVAPRVLFSDFFDGVSDFENFVKNKANEYNPFSQLLNYVGCFLDEKGKIWRIKDSGESSISNIPWIKLPGSTEWHVVSYQDAETLVITNAMVAAKKFERPTPIAPSKAGEKPQKSLGDVLRAKIEKSQFEQLEGWLSGKEPSQQQRPGTKPQGWSEQRWKDWKAQWAEWDKQRKLIQPSEIIKAAKFIDATKKNIIFISVLRVPIALKLGKVEKTKALVPLVQPPGAIGHLAIFDEIEADATFKDLFNLVFKPKNPLFKAPRKTLIFIKKLTCLNGALTQECSDLAANTKLSPTDRIALENCLVIFGTRDLDDDFHFSFDNKRIALNRTDNDTFEFKNISIGNTFDTAVRAQARALISFLVDAGFNPNIKNSDGTSVLSSAAISGDLNTVQLLLTVGAIPDRLAFECAATPEISKFLQEAQAKQASTSPIMEQAPALAIKQTSTLDDLQRAISHKDVVEISRLIKAKVDVNAKNEFGQTILMNLAMGASEFDPQIAELLIEAGAKLNAQNNIGMTALMIASFWGNEQVADFLIKAHADLNIKGGNGQTALMIAALMDKIKIIQSLLNANADATLHMEDGRSALDFAKNSGTRMLIESAIKKREHAKKRTIQMLQKSVAQEVWKQLKTISNPNVVEIIQIQLKGLHDVMQKQLKEGL